MAIRGYCDIDVLVRFFLFISALFVCRILIPQTRMNHRFSHCTLSMNNYKVHINGQ